MSCWKEDVQFFLFDYIYCISTTTDNKSELLIQHEIETTHAPKHIMKNNNSYPVLSNDSKVRRMSTRKQKFVGIRKQNSEAASITKHAKDSDASDSNSHKEERQRTSSSMNDNNDVQLSQPCERSKYQDTRRHNVEPRSYRDAVMSGQG